MRCTVRRLVNAVGRQSCELALGGPPTRLFSKVETAFAHVDLDWRDFVEVDPTLERGRAELHSLVGDASKAREQLSWEPTMSFEKLIELMVDADLARLAVPPTEVVNG